MFKKLQFNHCKAFVLSIFKSQYQTVRIPVTVKKSNQNNQFLDRVRKTYTLLALFGLMGLGSIHAQSADLVINPAISTVDPGDSFTVTVEVLTGIEVQVVDLAMTFDPALLQVTGTEITEVGPIPEGFFNEFDNTLGTITYQAFLLGGGAPDSDFNVVQIEFTAQASGVANIAFDQLGTGTQIAAPNGDLLLGSATGSTIFIDNTPPTLILLGANPQEITQGDPYIELGATANDDVDGNITANIVIDDSDVNTLVPGPYQVTYDVMDAAGNAAPQEVRIVNVVAVQSIPVIALDATASVAEGGTLNVPLSILDSDGDNLTVTITSISNEPDELQNNNGGINVVPYPNSADGFLSETGIVDNPGDYSSTLAFNPTFGDGASDGDDIGSYTITVQVDDEDGNSITQNLALSVTDTPQPIPNTPLVRVQAESYDDQGNTDTGGDGIGVETGSTGFVIGYTTEFDFAEYTLDIQQAGTYQMEFFASRQPAGSKNMNITTTAETAQLTVNSTAAWGTFQVFSVNVLFEAGVQTLRFDWVDGGGFYMNIDYFEMTWMDAPPTVDPIAAVEVLEGGLVSVPIQVNDDTDPSASIVIYDKGILGSNGPFTPGGVVDPSDYNFINNGGGSYTLEWQTQAGDARSYHARILANDGSNPVVEVPFNINVAIDISCGIIPAKYISNPLPWYGGGPQSPFTVAIETTPAENIGWIDAGEFVEYLINVPSAGTYNATFFAAKSNNGPLTVTLGEENGGGFSPIGSFDVNNNNNWQNYLPYPVQVTFANPGLQTLRLDFSGTGGVNIRDFTFTNNTPPTVQITGPPNLFGVEEGTEVILTGTASDTEDAGLDGSAIEWSSDLNGNLGNGASISLSNLIVGRHTITASVTDMDPNCMLTTTATTIVYIGVVPPECYEYIRVNAGGPLYASSTGDFEEDQSAANAGGAAQTGTPSTYFDASGTDTTFGATTPLVANNTGYPDYLFLTERWANQPSMDWSFTLPDGTYDVDLLFNENWSGEAANPRVFDVTIEGDLKLDDYRPSGPTGADLNIAKVESFQVEVLDGQLNISLIQGTQNPAIKGISICRVNDGPDVAIDTPGDGDPIQRGAPILITGSADDPEDGDISSGLSWSSSDPQFVTDPPNDTGPAVSGIFVNPGLQTLRAEATDSQGETDFDEINVDVQLPSVVIDLPLEGANLTDPSFTLEWTGTDVLYDFDEHYHIYVNPTAINDADPGVTRISTADFIGQENWNLGSSDGIVNGVNTILIRIANSNHDEFGDPNFAQDVVNFTVCDVAITEISSTDPLDCGVNDGTITISADGSNLEYSIDGINYFENNGQFTGLAGGTYDVYVRDKNAPSCEDEAIGQVTLTAPVLPEILSITPTPTSTCGATDGTLVISAQGTDLEYEIVGVAIYQDSNIFDNLAPGIYDINVREIGTTNCIVSGQATISEPFAPEITGVTVEDPSDCGLSDGTITIDATGSNLLYSIDGGATFFANNVFNDLPSGSYNIVIKENADANCSDSGSTTLTDPLAPVINFVTPTDVTDCDGPDGTITIDASGTNLEYSINGGAFQDSNVFTGLPADMYDIAVREQGAINCTAFASTGINAPSIPFISSVVPTDPTSCVVPDGTITVNATGIDLEFSLENGPFGPSNVFSGLGAGQYGVSVRVAGTSFCSVTGIVELFDPTPPLPIITGNPTYLQGTPGTTLDAGAGFASYSWSPGGETTQTITALAGTYTVTVIDANGCEGTSAEFEVTETTDNEDPTALCQAVFVSLDANGLGSITAQEVDNGSSDNAGIATLELDRTDFTCADLGEVQVTLTVTDVNGRTDTCTASVFVDDFIPPTITCPADIVVTVPFGSPGTVVNWPDAVGSDNCPGFNVFQDVGPPSGSFFATGTTTQILYQIDDSIASSFCGFNVIIEEDPDVDAPLIVVNADTDENWFALEDGMVIPKSLIGNTPLGIIYNADLNPNGIFFNLTGPINEQRSEGVSPPYSLFGDIGVNIQGQPFPVGFYTLIANPNNGPNQIVNFEVSAIDPDCVDFDASISSVSDPTTCGADNGSASISVSGFTGPLTITWSNGGSADQTTATNLEAGDYSVTVTDANGCTETLNFSLDDPDLPDVTLAPLGSVLSTDDLVTLVGSPPGGTYSGPGVSGNEFDPGIGPGTYTITYEYTDIDGCTNSAAQDIQVNPPFINAPLIVVNANTDENWFALEDGMVIPKSLIGNTPLGIIYNADLNPNGIFFNLTGPINEQRTEGISPPYSLFGDIGVNIQGQPFPVGFYTLIANPNNGPAQIVNFEVSAIDPDCIDFDASVSSVSDPMTCGADDGSASISVSGFTGPLTITWSNGGSADQTTATNLEAGDYSVTVTDANGCTETLNFSLVDPDLPNVTLSSFSDVFIDAPAFTLMGGMPMGGTYSGPGVDSGEFTPADAGAGTHTIVYEYTDGNGCTNEASQNITVIDPTGQDRVVSFTLIDALDNSVLDEVLEDNEEVDGPAISVNIRANTSPINVGSVKFILSGELTRDWTENFAPYALYGDTSGNYFPADLPVGEYTLTATPYSLSNGNGVAGIPLTIDFSVIDAGFFNKPQAVNPVSVSPNPADRTAKLDFLQPTWITDIYLFDVSGKLVKTIKADTGGDVDSYLMRVQDLPEATYFVKIKRNRGLDLQQRVVIKR